MLSSVQNNLEVVLTMLALHFMTQHMNTPENMLLIRKGKQWLQLESRRCGITE